MALDQDEVTAFLGRFVADLGATEAAGSVAVGNRLGPYRRSRRVRRRPRSSPSGPDVASGTSPSGCVDRPRAAMSATTRRPGSSR